MLECDSTSQPNIIKEDCMRYVRIVSKLNSVPVELSP